MYRLISILVFFSFSSLQAVELEDVFGRALDNPQISEGPSVFTGAIPNPGPLDKTRIFDTLTAISNTEELTLRGAREVSLYAQRSPAVALILTNEGLGSGSLLNEDGDIITNWHVVAGYSEVGVIFKPEVEGRQLSEADIVFADVIRTDEVADLALIRAKSVRTGIEPIPLGSMNQAAVGSDVHAIGHPTGESWTYTRGFVSQLRQGYEWTGDGIRIHTANVIQTQTPINPGNSGGPLLSNDGTLLGVNSFKSEGEALNFAVSVDEVRAFLARSEDRQAALIQPPTECEGVVLAEAYSAEYAANVQYLDADCDGQYDMEYIEPTDPSEPALIMTDSNGDGRFDTIFSDDDRDGEIDLSYYDVDDDGEPDLIGYHRSGELEPYRLERL